MNSKFLTFFENLKLFFLSLAEVFVALKIVQTIVILAYALFVWHNWEWFSSLSNPTESQTSGFIAVLGMATVVVGLFNTYVFHRGDWDTVNTAATTMRQRIYAARNVRRLTTQPQVDTQSEVTKKAEAFFQQESQSFSPPTEKL